MKYIILSLRDKAGTGDSGEIGPEEKANSDVGVVDSQFEIGIYHIRGATLYTNTYATRTDVIASCTTFKVYQDEYHLIRVDENC